MQPALVPEPHEIPEVTSVRAVDLGELESPIVKLGVATWRAQRGTRRYPPREALRPRDIAGALRNMVLVKVLNDGADYEFRIVGDAQVRAYAMRLQGRRLSDITMEAPTFGRIAGSVHNQVCRRGEPFAFRGRIGRDFPEANFIYIESAFLPLGATDDAVDHIVVFSTYIARAFSTDRQ